MPLHEVWTEVQKRLENVERQPREKEADGDEENHGVCPLPPSVVLHVLALGSILQAPVDGQVHHKHYQQGHHKLSKGGQLVVGRSGIKRIGMDCMCWGHSTCAQSKK